MGSRFGMWHLSGPTLAGLCLTREGVHWSALVWADAEWTTRELLILPSWNACVVCSEIRKRRLSVPLDVTVHSVQHRQKNLIFYNKWYSISSTCSTISTMTLLIQHQVKVSNRDTFSLQWQ